jgi:hypothetical protein
MLDLFRPWVPSGAKISPSGWYSYNAVCCHNRGHRPDKKKRGGVRYDNNSFAYHCFNCGFSAGWHPGQLLSNNLRQWLKWSGADHDTIMKINFALLRGRDDVAGVVAHVRKDFEERSLPEGARCLADTDLVVNHYDLAQPYYDYLLSRQLGHHLDRFYIDVNQTGPLKNRLIVPYYYDHKCVGYTARAIGDQQPKYYNYQQAGYVFNTDWVKPHYKYCLVVEGIMDAILVNGVAVTTNRISQDQNHIIDNLGKTALVVPDQDSAGLTLIDSALEYGYAVSFPNWDRGIKDINDAVLAYGLLHTLVSIFENIETSTAGIQVKMRLMKNRVNG